MLGLPGKAGCRTASVLTATREHGSLEEFAEQSEWSFGRMRFSVVIPCYNAEQYIRTSLTCSANQSLLPYEIIVIDDGSSDASVKVVSSLGIPVKVLHTNRLGGAGARNAGIQTATGEWLAFLDADDVWYENHLARANMKIKISTDRSRVGHCRDGQVAIATARHHP